MTNSVLFAPKFDLAVSPAFSAATCNKRKLEACFWDKVANPGLSWQKLVDKHTPGLAQKQLGRTLGPVIAAHAEWKAGRNSEFNAAAAPTKAEQRMIHKAAMKEASLLLSERRKKCKDGRLPNGEGAAFIIAEVKAAYPGWKGITSAALEQKAAKSPGESPNKGKNQDKRYLSDEVETAISSAVITADDANQQFSAPLLTKFIQSQIENTASADVFKKGLVTDSFTQGFIERMRAKQILDMGTPIEDTGSRLDWAHEYNLNEYYDLVAKETVRLGMARSNEKAVFALADGSECASGYDPNVRFSERIIWTDSSRFGMAGGCQEGEGGCEGAYTARLAEGSTGQAQARVVGGNTQLISSSRGSLIYFYDQLHSLSLFGHGLRFGALGPPSGW
jgi:hypothetical protein